MTWLIDEVLPSWADRVMVLRDGQVVEEGMDEKLHRPGTLYFDLWLRQPEEARVESPRGVADIAHAPVRTSIQAPVHPRHGRKAH